MARSYGIQEQCANIKPVAMIPRYRWRRVPQEPRAGIWGGEFINPEARRHS